MTITQAIKKATQAGWFAESGDSNMQSLYRTLLDVYFWQYLGKALGWKGEKVRMCVGCGVALRWNEKETMDGKHGGKIGCGSDIEEYSGQWLIEMHRFIDYLAENKSIESFFKYLV